MLFLNSRIEAQWSPFITNRQKAHFVTAWYFVEKIYLNPIGLWFEWPEVGTTKCYFTKIVGLVCFGIK